MKNDKKLYVGSAAILLVLSACGARIRPMQPMAAETGTPTSEPAVMADTWHTFELSAWQDIDGDGLWGSSELPLEGVRFALVAGPMAEVWGYPPISDAEGRMKFVIWHPGGGPEDETYTISAEPPDSFQPTTPVLVTFSIKPSEVIHQVLFGFRPFTG